jgi:hypothetical protein
MGVKRALQVPAVRCRVAPVLDEASTSPLYRGLIIRNGDSTTDKLPALDTARADYLDGKSLHVSGVGILLKKKHEKIRS